MEEAGWRSGISGSWRCTVGEDRVRDVEVLRAVVGSLVKCRLG